MTETHVFCDLCKKPIEPWDKKAEFKIKKKAYFGGSSKWVECDVHEKCAKKFRDLCLDKIPNVNFESESPNVVHCIDCAFYSDDGYCVNHSNYFGSYFYCGYGAKHIIKKD